MRVPGETGGQDFALHLYPIFMLPISPAQSALTGINRATILRNNDPLRVEVIQQRKALLFELGHVNLHHAANSIVGKNRMVAM